MKLGLFGATGRMGGEIRRLIEEAKDLELVMQPSRTESVKKEKTKGLDVWIDFSLPEAFEKNLQVALTTQKAFVCGTTGLSEKQYAKLRAASKKIPVLWASNMSVGVAILNRALQVFASSPDFDFQIEEIHHIHKKDKPSGTALTLQKNLEKAVGRKVVDPVAIRGGGVFGVHKIFAMAPEEIITFEHTALNRRVFAKGALKAARWLAGQKPGLYSIDDCLFSKKKDKTA